MVPTMINEDCHPVGMVCASRFGSLEAKVDMIIAMLEEQRKVDREDRAELSSRVSSVERRAWYASGVAAVIAAAAAKLGIPLIST